MTDVCRGDVDEARQLLGLHAASEVGIPVKPEVWTLSRQYWELAQRRGGFETGSWGYYPNDHQPATGSMTCAGKNCAGFRTLWVSDSRISAGLRQSARNRSPGWNSGVSAADGPPSSQPT